MIEITKENYIKYLNKLENKYNGNIPDDDVIFQRIKKLFETKKIKHSNFRYDIFDKKGHLVFFGKSNEAVKFLNNHGFPEFNSVKGQHFNELGTRKIEYGNYFMLRKDLVTGEYVNGKCYLDEKSKYEIANICQDYWLYRIYDKNMKEIMTGRCFEACNWFKEHELLKPKPNVMNMSQFCKRGSCVWGNYFVIRVNRKTGEEVHLFKKRKIDKIFIAFDYNKKQIASGYIRDLFWKMKKMGYKMQFMPRKARYYNPEKNLKIHEITDVNYFARCVQNNGIYNRRNFLWGYIKKESELYD